MAILLQITIHPLSTDGAIVIWVFKHGIYNWNEFSSLAWCEVQFPHQFGFNSSISIKHFFPHSRYCPRVQTSHRAQCCHNRARARSLRVQLLPSVHLYPARLDHPDHMYQVFLPLQLQVGLEGISPDKQIIEQDVSCQWSGSGPMVQHYCHGIIISIHSKPV